jgi:hypothetical protein
MHELAILISRKFLTIVNHLFYFILGVIIKTPALCPMRNENACRSAAARDTSGKAACARTATYVDLDMYNFV